MFRIRILHVSDAHFRSSQGSLPASRIDQVRREAWRRSRVLGEGFREEIRRTAAAAPIDAVCFTGDAADWGQPSEFDEASAFLQHLIDDAGVTLNRLFVVPGNHDIERAVGASSWTALRRLAGTMGEAALSNWMAGGATPATVDGVFKAQTLERETAYREWLVRLGRPELTPERSAHGRLGYRVTLALPQLPFPVHVIGLDSAWLAGDENDEGKLILTQDQIGLLATDETGRPLPGFRLVLVHHPLTQLADGTTAKGLLADYTDLVLRGHQHDPLVDAWRDPDRGLVELAAGCLYEGAGGHRYPNGYGVIDAVLDERGRPQQYEVWFRSWSPRGHWHDDGALYRSAPNGHLVIPAGATGGPHLGGPLSQALEEQWNACRSGRVPIQTFHKLLVVMRVSPAYAREVFDTAGSAVAERVSEWLHRQAERHAAATQGTAGEPVPIDRDESVAAARRVAIAEGSVVVDARHLLIALLRDKNSNTIMELRTSLDALRPSGFGDVQRAAENLRPQLRRRTVVDDLDLSEGS